MTKMGMVAEKKKPKKSRRTDYQKLKDTLDNLFSYLIRKQAEFTCEYCGKSTGQMHCHHGVVGRRYINTRYEMDNCACVCVGCHNFLGDFKGQNTAFFTKRIGSDRYEQLEIMARSGRKVDLEEIKVRIKELDG